MYKLNTNPTSITRNSDGATIPTDPTNSDYAAYLKWVDGGNTPAPADVPSANDIRAAKWEAIKAKRELLSDTGGYPVTVGGVVKWFHSDGKSKTQQLGLARRADRLQSSGGDLAANFAGPGPGGTLPWKTMDKSFVLMTGNVAQAVVDAAEQQDMAIFAAAAYHEAMLNASATPETYNFSAGWPATYGA